MSCVIFSVFATTAPTVDVNASAVASKQNKETMFLNYGELVNSFETELNATDRIRFLHDFYRVGEETNFKFNMKESMKKGQRVFR